MKTVKEVARLASISVRTLHYYDQIGLLRPSEVTPAGYRLYDDTALSRLMQILFYRELDFPLEEIRKILDSASFDTRRALEQHRTLLILKRSRLERLIGLVERTLEGDIKMSFEEFNTDQIEQARRLYAQEAKERWGATDAYRESEKKTSRYGKEDWSRLQEQIDLIFRGLAGCMHLEPGAPEVQELVADWQAHITENYYSCSREMLAGLGEMYVGDERFLRSLNSRYGEGTAEFASRAIRIYCAQHRE